MTEDKSTVLSESQADRITAEALIVDIDGFQGPLDILLTLARTQKVDLRNVSILQLAETYIDFIEKAKSLRIELAADYLVMAAWLAYLKSRLLLPPDPKDEGPSGEELAAHLAFQLERLEAMRDVGARLMARDQLGRDFFARGAPENFVTKKDITFTASLLDLLQAYSRIKTKDDFIPLVYQRDPVFSIEQAIERMRHIVGNVLEWRDLESLIPKEWQSDPRKRRSAIASTFAASLELAKSGQVEIDQEQAFDPINLRKRVER